MTISFTIPGEPQGKARPRIVRSKHTGKSISYTPDKTVAYEELVRAKYIKEAPFVEFEDKPLKVSIKACFSIPKSKSKKVKNLMLRGEISPTKKPDCDNIAKIVCDALNGIAYKDDSQIVSLEVIKEYSDIPRTEVEISD